MLLIQSEVDSSITIGLLTGVDYTVGRKDCTIVVQNDQSISRKHAVLHVHHSGENLTFPQKYPKLTIEDHSKYGTCVNGKKIDKQQTVVKAGDIVTFGILGSKWSIKYEPLVVTTSCLDANEKKTVKEWTLKLGGHLLPEYTSSCTHVIMSKLTVTIKAVCALISQNHIVIPEFLKDWIVAYESGKEAPNPLRYLPPLAETCLKEKDISFTPNEKRKTVFQGKTFIFLMKKQYKKLGQAIELGGGKSVLMMAKVDEDVLTAHHTCVMAFCTDQNSQPSNLIHATNVVAILKKYNKRTISESEIGLAVIYCSTEKFCNPDVDAAKSGIDTSDLVSQSINTQLYVADTESFNMKKIPSTLTQPEIQSQSLERIIPPTILDQEVKTQLLSQANTGQTLSFKEPFPVSKSSQSGAALMKKRLRENDILPESLEKTPKHIKKEVADSEELYTTDTLPLLSVKEEKLDNFQKKRTLSDWPNEQPETKMIKTETITDNYHENTNSSLHLTSTTFDSKVTTDPIVIHDSQTLQKKFENKFSEIGKDTSLFLNELMSRNSDTSSNNLSESKKRQRNDSESEEKNCEVVQRKLAKLSTSENNLSVLEENNEPTTTKAASNEKCEDVQRKLAKVSTSENNLSVLEENTKPTTTKSASNVSTLYPENEAEFKTCVVIEVVSLVKSPAKKNSVNCNSTFSSGKNFKKFKKVQNTVLSRLPKIIGGQDLAPYYGPVDVSLDFLNERASDHSSEEEECPFNFEPRSTKRPK